MLVAPDRIGDFSPAEWLAGHREELPLLETAVVVGAETPGALSWERLAAGGPPLPRDWREPTAADPFLLLYTSGTTSNPKGVPLSYHQMLSNARLGLAEHDVRAGDVILSAAPFGHLYALYSVELALAAGAANGLLPAFSPPALADALERLRPTHLFLAPAHLAACVGTGLLERMDLSSVRLVVLAGAAVPPDLVRALAPHLPNGEVCQLWGMTELQAGLYTRIGDGRTWPPEAPAALRRVRKCASPTSTAGRSRAARRASSRRGGPSVFAGYYENPEATSAAFTADGWFRSGDTGRMDEAGNVTLTGRLKDVINRGGVKYNPQELELLVESLPAVVQCAIAPVPDERLGERACCYVVLRPAESVTLEAICDFLLGHGIAKFKLPERLEIVEEMPLTPTRKVVKGRLRPPDPSPERERSSRNR